MPVVEQDQTERWQNSWCGFLGFGLVLGELLSAKGGKNAKKRALVAVARKLAVLLHKLWVSGEVYEPLRNKNSKTVAA
jgi:hypothetical protein